MTAEQVKLDEFFVDRNTLVERIIEEAKTFMHIDKDDCIPILPIPLDSLSYPDRILLELATAYLCFVKGLKQQGCLSRDVLAKRCRMSDSVLRARLSDLRKSDMLSSSEAGETITTPGLVAFRDLLRRLMTNPTSGKK